MASRFCASAMCWCIMGYSATGLQEPGCGAVADHVLLDEGWCGLACFVASHELSDHFRLEALADAVDPMIGANSTFERCSAI